MQTYETVKIEWVPLQQRDVICTSDEGTVEDNYGWLSNEG